MRAQKDVIVIGINGVSIAYHLARHGTKVVLLEKSFIAGGPTGLSSAIVRQHYSNPITAKMARKSLQVWQNFNEIIGGDCGFTNTGVIFGVAPHDIDGLKANISMQKAAGINTSFVSVEEIHEIEPFADPRGLGGAAFEPESGYCDPSTAANSFAQAAVRLGAEIRTGVTATDLLRIAGKIEGVETDHGVFPGRHIIIACGPWSQQFLARLGIEVPIIAARVKIGLYRRPQDFTHHRIWGDFINQIYLRPEGGNLMLVGSISPDEAADRVDNPDHYNEKVDLDTLTDFAERAASRFPAMEHSHLTHSYSALYDITPDWHSIMDEVPGYEGLYLCAGSSGHGFKLAPAVGEMMTRLLLEGKQQEDDINLFSFDRFEKDRLIHSQYAYNIIG
jgi:sarcosine oxidase subunit beta